MLACGFFNRSAWAAEPVITDYTAMPIFIEQASAKPNILIMLDNSGSMNTWAYQGQAYNCSPQWTQVGSSTDDAQQNTASPYAVVLTDNELNLGQKPVGLRFKNVRIPRGSTIVNAYLRFRASANAAGASLTIRGQEIGRAHV